MVKPKKKSSARKQGRRESEARNRRVARLDEQQRVSFAPTKASSLPVAPRAGISQEDFLSRLANAYVAISEETTSATDISSGAVVTQDRYRKLKTRYTETFINLSLVLLSVLSILNKTNEYVNINMI
jgi:hypothetical protein